MIREASSGRVPSFVTPGRAHRRRSLQASPVHEEIEMQPMRPRRPRRAMSGQTKLRPLNLGAQAPTPPRDATAAGPSTAPRGTGLTDAEMMEAEQWWPNESDGQRWYTIPNLRNPFRSSSSPRERRPAGFGILQADGSVAQVIQNGRGAGMLLSVEEGRNMMGRMEQRALSRPYMWASALTPISAVLFGVGAFDALMARRTGGRIAGMDEEDKWQALFLLAPLSLLVWGIVAVVVVLAVAAAEGGL